MAVEEEDTELCALLPLHMVGYASAAQLGCLSPQDSASLRLQYIASVLELVIAGGIASESLRL